MNIRAFSKDDTEAVIELWRDCGLTRPWNDPLKDIERKLLVQPELFIIGEVENSLIATAMVGYDGHRGSIYYFAVSPEHQNSGYGRKLMEKVETLLIELGCPKLNIVVRSSNNQALDFYKTLNFEPDNVVSIGKRLISDSLITQKKIPDENAF